MAIGVTIVTGIAILFNTLNIDVLSGIKGEQGTSVGDQILSNIEELYWTMYKSAPDKDDRAYIEFQIPLEIGGMTYNIEGFGITGCPDNCGINIKGSNGETIITKDTTIPIEGVVSSSSKRIRLTYFVDENNKKINIKGVSY